MKIAPVIWTAVGLIPPKPIPVQDQIMMAMEIIQPPHLIALDLAVTGFGGNFFIVVSISASKPPLL